MSQQDHMASSFVTNLAKPDQLNKGLEQVRVVAKQMKTGRHQKNLIYVMMKFTRLTYASTQNKNKTYIFSFILCSKYRFDSTD